MLSDNIQEGCGDQTMLSSSKVCQESIPHTITPSAASTIDKGWDASF